MKKIHNLSEKVTAIININLEDIIPELRPLLAAMLMSPDVECQRLRMNHPDDKMIEYFLEQVALFRKDTKLFDLYAQDGYFVEQLQHMLSVARKNRKAASRLMPIFCTALNDKKRYNIPAALELKIINHIEGQRKRDHFAITRLEPGNIEIVPAPGYSAE